ncbi:heavy metal-associated domain-containing protein [Streptosporangium sp. NPDC023963]|uniref:heavy-metal-associated domain-containing protein n=1 Tax=Streptosporangium sp. NPDC023963 TaxID=3155608 RepID=UPI003441DC00
MSVVTTYAVQGMTCGGCAKRVRTALNAAIPGLEAIDIDLQAGQVRISAPAPVPAETVQAAVETTKYRFAGVLS